MRAREACRRARAPRALGIRRGEQRAHRPALGVPEERGALRPAASIRRDVVHPLLERRHVRPRGRRGRCRACRSRIRRENDASRSKKRATAGSSQKISMFETPAGDEDEVARAVADDLVGDVDVAAACVLGFGLHGLGSRLLRQLRLAPVLRRVARHDDQHLASGEQAASRMLALAVELTRGQRRECLVEPRAQSRPALADRLGVLAARDPLARIVALVRSAAQRAEQILLGVAEHVRDDRVEAVGRRRGRPPVQRGFVEPVEGADERVDRVVDEVHGTTRARDARNSVLRQAEHALAQDVAQDLRWCRRGCRCRAPAARRTPTGRRRAPTPSRARSARTAR